jgi:hypothetical protein
MSLVFVVERVVWLKGVARSVLIEYRSRKDGRARDEVVQQDPPAV